MFKNKQYFLRMGICFVLCSSLILLPKSFEMTAETSPSTELVNTNLNEEDAEVLVSAKLSNDEEIPSNILEYLKSNDVSLGAGGIQTEEMYVKPTPVILDSQLVPNGEGICNSANITYMAYTSVTNTTSNQYRLLYGADAYTDETTGLRMVDGRICIAVGTFYTSKIGTKINLIMTNGSVVECILGDVKSDMHTDDTHRYQKFDGSVVEVIVDYNYFSSTNQYPEALRGTVSRIEIVE